jgi:hypothetical protein
LSVRAALTPGLRYAIFAFPMVATLLVGAIYLLYAAAVCDPLYTDSAESAGYEAESGMSALRPLLPPGYKGGKSMPVPRRDFGVACGAAAP